MKTLNIQFPSAYYYFISFGPNILHNTIYILKSTLDRAETAVSHSDAAEQDYRIHAPTRKTCFGKNTHNIKLEKGTHPWFCADDTIY
jgi:hypothetical protein